MSNAKRYHTFLLLGKNINNFIGFTLASFAIALSPGPSWIYIISSTVEFGKKAGLVAMLGNSTGILFHTIAVSLGLSALVFYSQALYSIIKWLGVLYLVYLAIKILINRNSLDSIANVSNRQFKQIYKNGILVNLLNPKAVLLMFALLPQFVNAQNGNVVLQMGMLGCIHIVMASVVLTTLCFSVSKISGTIQQSWIVQKLFRWTSASLLFVFAAKLIFFR